MCRCMCLILLNVMIEISNMHAERNILISDGSSVLLDSYSWENF
jgi:hypothetical protein